MTFEDPEDARRAVTLVAIRDAFSFFSANLACELKDLHYVVNRFLATPPRADSRDLLHWSMPGEQTAKSEAMNEIAHSDEYRELRLVALHLHAMSGCGSSLDQDGADMPPNDDGELEEGDDEREDDDEGDNESVDEDASGEHDGVGDNRENGLTDGQLEEDAEPAAALRSLLRNLQVVDDIRLSNALAIAEAKYAADRLALVAEAGQRFRAAQLSIFEWLTLGLSKLDALHQKAKAICVSHGVDIFEDRYTWRMTASDDELDCESQKAFLTDIDLCGPFMNQSVADFPSAVPCLSRLRASAEAAALLEYVRNRHIVVCRSWTRSVLANQNRLLYMEALEQNFVKFQQHVQEFCSTGEVRKADLVKSYMLAAHQPIDTDSWIERLERAGKLTKFKRNGRWWVRAEQAVGLIDSRCE